MDLWQLNTLYRTSPYPMKLFGTSPQIGTALCTYNSLWLISWRSINKSLDNVIIWHNSLHQKSADIDIGYCYQSCWRRWSAMWAYTFAHCDFTHVFLHSPRIQIDAICDVSTTSIQRAHLVHMSYQCWWFWVEYSFIFSEIFRNWLTLVRE